MSGSDTVTMTFAGDSDSLEKAAQRSQDALGKVGTKADETSTSISTVGEKFHSVGETSDKFATKTGTLAGGVGAVASGMVLLGVNSDSTAGKIVGGIAVALGTLSGIFDIVSIASEAMTTAQWAQNAAFLASPITWIVVGIIALVAIIVVIATKTRWFQDIWEGAWKGIKIAVGAVKDFFVDTVWHGGFEKVFSWIGDKVGAVVGWFQGIPDKLGSAFSTIFDIVSGPFKLAFNFVSDAWNNTIGKLHWHFPGAFGVGSFDISAPQLPKFHSGGVVPGLPGQEVIAVLQAGERVVPASQRGAPGAASYGDIIINGGVHLDNGYTFDQWIKDVRDYQRQGVGDVNA